MTPVRPPLLLVLPIAGSVSEYVPIEDVTGQLCGLIVAPVLINVRRNYDKADEGRHCQARSRQDTDELPLKILLGSMGRKRLYLHIKRGHQHLLKIL
jgi:hypothetical protein